MAAHSHMSDQINFVASNDAVPLVGALANAESAATPLDEALRGVLDFLSSYVEFQEPLQGIAIALWVAHTWAFQASDFTPYLSIQSPAPRCGKSTLLDCLALVVRNPWQAISPTGAVLFRKIESQCPTLLLDEGDTIWSGKKDPTKEDLRGILNSGFQRSSKVSRCVPPNHALVDFSVYCPKAIAGIGQLPPTIADRSLPIVLARKPKDSIAKKFRRREAEASVVPLVQFFKEWASDEVLVRLANDRPALPDELNSRAMDICEPLLAIADLAGGDWPIVARQSLVDLCGEKNREEDVVQIRLLADIRHIFHREGISQMFSNELVRALVTLESDSPWAMWWESDVSYNRMGAPTTRLAQMLKGFGVSSRLMRDGDIVLRGYRLSDFRDVFEKYLPPLE
jgi:hypothetical protein